MNVLFFVTCTPSPENGGVERVTYTLTKELKERGFRCFCAYLYEVNNREGVNLYDGIFQFDYTRKSAKNEMVEYLQSNHIDIIVNQFATIDTLSSFFYDIRMKTNIKLITCYHFDPLAGYSKDRLFANVSVSLKAYLAFLFKKNLYFLFKIFFCYIRKKRFQRGINGSDKFIFLSHSHIDSLFKYYHIDAVDKIKYIPNPLSFDCSFDINLANKKKNVLIVSRLKEDQKRVGLSLLIWKELEKYNYNGWTLNVLGYGDDLDFYLDMVNKETIKNVHFCGHQNPIEYYKESSILIMTSPSEGFGMTLIEAKQMGCVPMAMSSIAFTSVYDIINDGIDGYVIASDDIKQYTEKLHHLMINDQLRMMMAKNGIEDSKRFLAGNIVDKWIEVFER